MPSRQQPPVLDVAENRGDRRAYALLEEARMRCEALSTHARTESDRAALSLIHKELGLAGYLASEDIEPERRLGLVETARTRSTNPPPAADKLIETAAGAEAAIGEGPQTEAWADHMHLSHLHLLRARELLGEMRHADRPGDE